MSDSEVFSRPNDEARIFDFEQFTLWANTPERPGRRARMVFGERNGAPRISVYPNTEEGPKALSVGMSPVIWYDFLARFSSIAKGEPGKSIKIENMGRGKSEDGQEAKAPPVLKNTLWFGKDEKGVCWLAIEQKDAVRIRFPILASYWHNFYKQDGTKLTPEECSVSQTLALIEALKAATSNFVGRLRRPLPARNKQGAQAEPKPVPSSTPVTQVFDDIPL